MNRTELILSVILPVWNTEEYFEECLNSLVSQMDEHGEIIVVDDGSTDACGAIADRYSRQYPELIRVYHQENLGNLIARYRGISHARGRYIGFVDSDDTVSDRWYASILNVIRSQEPDMILLRWQKYDDEGHLFDTDRPPLFADGPVSKKEVLRVFFSSQRVTGLPLKVVKRRLFTEETDYSDRGTRRLMEDKLMSIQLFENAETFWYISDILYYYRTNLRSITIRPHENEHFTLTYTYPPVDAYLKRSGYDSEEFRTILVENYASVMWEIMLKTHRVSEKNDALRVYAEIRGFPFTSLIFEYRDRFTLPEYKLQGISLLLEGAYEAAYVYVGKIRENPDLDHRPDLRKLGKL